MSRQQEAVSSDATTVARNREAVSTGRQLFAHDRPLPQQLLTRATRLGWDIVYIPVPLPLIRRERSGVSKSVV
jgi:shikimate 5-dehydrogenase